MKIVYLGHSCFVITGKTTLNKPIKVIIDPYNPKNVGISYNLLSADIVAITHEHDDHNYLKKIKNEYFLIDTPGEYEIKGLRVYGIKSYHDDKEGSIRGLNTIYIFDFKEARVAHLGDLGHDLSKDQLKSLSNIDILMIPIGGIYTIDAKKALELIEKIEPTIVIPMHYKTPSHNKAYEKLGDVKSFATNAGLSEYDISKELTIKSHSDLPQELTFKILES